MSKACAAGLSKGRATPSVASPERGLEEDEKSGGIRAREGEDKEWAQSHSWRERHKSIKANRCGTRR
jgi:hypothetical protein